MLTFLNKYLSEITEVKADDYINYIRGVMFTSYVTKSVKQTKKSYYINENKYHTDNLDVEAIDKIAYVMENTIMDNFYIDDIIEDTKLYKFLKKLTRKQKDIIYNCFIYLYNETEVAKLLGISKQAVNKTKKKIIAKAAKYRKDE